MVESHSSLGGAEDGVALRSHDIQWPRWLGRHVWSCLVLVITAILYLMVGSIIGWGRSSEPTRAIRAAEGSPLTNPYKLKPAQMSADPRASGVVRARGEIAITTNAALPISDLPNPPGKPFVFSSRSEADRKNAIACLTSAIYYEAALEPEAGQRAVAQVVLNRVRHPAWPNSVCGVVFEGAERVTGCQFTFTCDGALRREPNPALWKRAQIIAEDALAGKVFAPVGLSTHYHTDWIVPYWADSLVKAQVVGTHIFYRWTGGWGRPRAFRAAHSGSEPVLKMMRLLSGKTDPLGRATLIASAFSASRPGAIEVGGDPPTALAMQGEKPPVVVGTASVDQAPPSAKVFMAEPPKAMLDRIQQFCRRKQRCFKKQKLSMQQVFAALAAAPGDPSWRLCTTAAARGVLTNWVEANECLKSASRKALVASAAETKTVRPKAPSSCTKPCYRAPPAMKVKLARID